MSVMHKEPDASASTSPWDVVKSLVDVASMMSSFSSLLALKEDEKKRHRIDDLRRAARYHEHALQALGATARARFRVAASPNTSDADRAHLLVEARVEIVLMEELRGEIAQKLTEAESVAAELKVVEAAKVDEKKCFRDQIDSLESDNAALREEIGKLQNEVSSFKRSYEESAAQHAGLSVEYNKKCEQIVIARMQINDIIKTGQRHPEASILQILEPL